MQDPATRTPQQTTAPKKIWRRPQWRARNVRTHC